MKQEVLSANPVNPSRDAVTGFGTPVSLDFSHPMRNGAQGEEGVDDCHCFPPALWRMAEVLG